MLDIKRIREDFDNVKSAVEKRGHGDYEIGRAVELDDKRRDLFCLLYTSDAADEL